MINSKIANTVITRFVLTVLIIFTLFCSCKNNIESTPLLIKKISIEARVARAKKVYRMMDNSAGFHDGLAYFQESESKNWGFIDKEGKVAIEPIFSEVDQFSCGIALVRIGERESYIDTAGKFIDLPNFSLGDRCNDNIVMVSIDSAGVSYKRFVKKNGEWLNNSFYAESWGFSEGLANVKVNGKWGYINTLGEIQIPCKYHMAREFKNGLASVTTDSELWGCIDSKGSIVIPMYFDNFIDFNNDRGRIVVGWGYQSVERNFGPVKSTAREWKPGRYGFINKKGEIVIPPILEAPDPLVNLSFHDGLAIVVVGRFPFSRLTYMDVQGNRWKSSFKYAERFSEGLAVAGKNINNLGFINTSGNYLIKPSYKEAIQFSEGSAIVQDESGWYILKRFE
jgi:hypothetical protein